MSTETFHVEAFIFVVILIIYVLTSHIIENRKVPYMHESSIAILMGVVTAIISKYVVFGVFRYSISRSTFPMISSLQSYSRPSSSRQGIVSGNRCFFRILGLLASSALWGPSSAFSCSLDGCSSLTTSFSC